MCILAVLSDANIAAKQHLVPPDIEKVYRGRFAKALVMFDHGYSAEDAQVILGGLRRGQAAGWWALYYGTKVAA